MLISNFDLYKTEWLELVFENRNKAYGAYELRQHNSRTVAMAMLFTFLGVGVALAANALMASHHTTTPKVEITTVNLKELKDPAKKLPPPVIPKRPKPIPPVATVKFVPLVVRPDIEAKEPPKIEQLTTAISTTTTKGKEGELPVTIEDPGPAVDKVLEDNTVYPTSGVQIFPTPVGGEDAWNKFLSKNLRYPREAQDAGMGGRVYMSFVVEKDGSLSNFTVERGAGYGMDEEAARVLKLAKAWKPGIQNGRPVRVKFVIPINFQLSDNSN